MKIHIFAAAMFLASVPFVVDASVLISEVAWMGISENANAEWIELYNDGPAQDVTGWTLTASDGQPQITLSGTIAANTFALLERTSDDTVSGVTAFTVYVGALGNTGEILDLRDVGGVLVDRVDGSNDWAIGGSNDTKETLQRTGNPPVGSWTTGAATPQGGALGSTEDDENESTQANDDSTNTETTETATSSANNVATPSSGGSRSRTPRREPALTLDVGTERTVTVGVPVSFLARAYKESNKEIVVHDVLWNFGDGTTRTGREVQHTFLYPGDYVVSVTGNRSGFVREIKDSTRVIVHVIEPTFTIAAVTNKYIEIENESANELDLSGFTLIIEGAHFVVPTGTVLLPQTSVRFPRKATGLVPSRENVSLFYPDGVLAARHGAPAAVEQVAPQRVASYSDTRATSGSVPQATQPSALESVELPVVSQILQPAAVAAAFEGSEALPAKESNLWWWLLGLLTVIFIALVTISLIRREQAEVIEGFEIESDE